MSYAPRRRRARRLIFFSLPLLLLPLAAQATLKASDYIGRSVVVADGERLGRVVDFALSDNTREVRYFVVDVGSFLIEDRLIAVAPDALRPSADGTDLVVDSNRLNQASRFSSAAWPDQADVTRGSSFSSANASGTAAAADSAAEASDSAFGVGGTASIRSRWREATLVDGKTTIRDLPGSPLAASAKPGPLPAFERLDRNRTGHLGRSEIGAHLSPGTRYTDLDLDGNGVIEKNEYQSYVRAEGR